MGSYSVTALKGVGSYFVKPPTERNRSANRDDEARCTDDGYDCSCKRSTHSSPRQSCNKQKDAGEKYEQADEGNEYYAPLGPGELVKDKALRI